MVDCRTPNSADPARSEDPNSYHHGRRTSCAEVLEAGARGFVLKSDAARDLVAAVEALQAGTTFFTSRIGKWFCEHTSIRGEVVPSASPIYRVLPRGSADGATSRRGEEHERGRLPLKLGVKTAERQRSNIMRKLGFHSTSELVLYAVRNHIIEIHIGPQ